MFDFISPTDYTPFFNYGVLLLILALAQCFTGMVLQRDTVRLNAVWGVAVVTIVILYMGLRPVSGWLFGDMGNYAAGFRKLVAFEEPFKWSFEGEWAFANMTRLLAKLTDEHGYFLCCATIYVGSLWLAMVRMFRSYYYIPFLVIICMFTFWAYGTNGIRNGLGASVFILAMTYVENLPVMAVLCLIAAGFHQSVWMMIGAAVLAYYVKNSYYYLAGLLMKATQNY